MKIAVQPWFLYALLSAVFAALTTIFAKIGVQNVSSNLATLIRTVIILLFISAIVFFTKEAVGVFSLSKKTIFFLVLSGITTGLSWLCYFKALQIGKASLVAPVDKSSLLLIVVFAWIFLGETISAKSVIAVVLMLAGTIMLAL